MHRSGVRWDALGTRRGACGWRQRGGQHRQPRHVSCSAQPPLHWAAGGALRRGGKGHAAVSALDVREVTTRPLFPPSSPDSDSHSKPRPRHEPRPRHDRPATARAPTAHTSLRACHESAQNPTQHTRHHKLKGTDEWNPLPPVCQKPLKGHFGLLRAF
eukprot:7378685-Prymnesium_polylepis.1